MLVFFPENPRTHGLPAHLSYDHLAQRRAELRPCARKRKMGRRGHRCGLREYRSNHRNREEFGRESFPKSMARLWSAEKLRSIKNEKRLGFKHRCRRTKSSRLIWRKKFKLPSRQRAKRKSTASVFREKLFIWAAGLNTADGTPNYLSKTREQIARKVDRAERSRRTRRQRPHSHAQCSFGALHFFVHSRSGDHQPAIRATRVRSTQEHW